VSKKSAGKHPFLLNLDPELLEQVRARAKALDKNVTQYFAALARADIAKGGEFVVIPKRGVYYPEKPDEAYLVEERENKRPELTLRSSKRKIE
jgi:hypothetical protein